MASKEVDRHKTVHVILREGPPGLRRRFSLSHHVFGRRGLRDLDSQFEHLAVDARGAPAWVVTAHHPNQVSPFRRHGRPPPLPVANFPPPEETKTFSMPGDHCFRLHDQQGGLPVIPHAAEPDPEEAINGCQLQAFGRRTPRHGELLPQGEVFQPELGRGLAQRTERAQRHEQVLPYRPQEQVKVDQPS